MYFSKLSASLLDIMGKSKEIRQKLSTKNWEHLWEQFPKA
jgi:hypothetical protein